MEYVLSFERIAEKRGMKKGKEKWLKIGRKKGIEEEREKTKKTALRMLENGFDIDLITKITELPVEEIKKLSPKEN